MNCFELLLITVCLVAGILIGAWVAESHAWYVALCSGLLTSLAIFGTINVIGFLAGKLHKRRGQGKNCDKK